MNRKEANKKYFKDSKMLNKKEMNKKIYASKKYDLEAINK